MIFLFWSFSMIPPLQWLKALVGMADYIGNYFYEQSSYCYTSWLIFSHHNSVVSPSSLLILYFEFFYHSSSHTSATTCSDICIHWKYFYEQSNYHHISPFFFSAQQRHFTVTIFDCYILKFFYDSSSWIITNTRWVCWLHWKLLCWSIKLLPYIMIFIPAQWRRSPPQLYIIMFWSFSVIPPLRWLQPLIGFADYIGNYFSERSNYFYISWLFFSDHNCVLLPVTVVDCYTFKCFYHSSSRMSTTTCSDRFLQWKYFPELVLSPYTIIVFLPEK